MFKKISIYYAFSPLRKPLKSQSSFFFLITRRYKIFIILYLNKELIFIYEKNLIAL